MRYTTLIVPGFHGSEAAHWQSWLEARQPGACRVSEVDWEAPVLARWAARVRAAIDAAPHPVWLVAHSFGCLASLVAAAERPDRVAGALLVAPADPQRFSPLGLQSDPAALAESIAPLLPQSPLAFPSVVVASSNDPWLKLTVAAYWAERWRSQLINLGPAGHVNVDSGYGAWPQGLALLNAMLQAHGDVPLGEIDGGPVSKRGRGGALARVRQGTRNCAERQTRAF